jgi:hypothetical protein
MPLVAGGVQARLVTSVRGQFLKARYPMVVTELGRVTDDREVQEEKASPPMVVTELGRVTDVRYEKPLKAFTPMIVTPLLTTTEVMEFRCTNHGLEVVP